MITRFEGEFEFLSNFYECGIDYEGLVYRSVEHAYQAAKTKDTVQRSLIACAPTPALAKKMGRTLEIREDWNDVKLIVMKELVRQKFTCHKDLQKKLLATGSQMLVEGNWWKDTFWGVCDGKGDNHLGKILMEVRYELVPWGYAGAGDLNCCRGCGSSNCFCHTLP